MSVKTSWIRLNSKRIFLGTRACRRTGNTFLHFFPHADIFHLHPSGAFYGNASLFSCWTGASNTDWNEIPATQSLSNDPPQLPFHCLSGDKEWLLRNVIQGMRSMVDSGHNKTPGNLFLAIRSWCGFAWWHKNTNTVQHSSWDTHFNSIDFSLLSVRNMFREHGWPTFCKVYRKMLHSQRELKALRNCLFDEFEC